MRAEFINLGVTLLITGLVWKHYQRKTVILTEQYSTFWPRFLSGFVDSCILWPINFITSALLSLNLPKSVAVSLLVIQSLAWVTYTIVMHGRYGQTVGKMMTKVKVVNFRTQKNISWQQAWLREGIPALLGSLCLVWEVFLIIDGQLDPRTLYTDKELSNNHILWVLATLDLLWFVIETLTMLFNKKRRALHDFIAGTVVIRTNIEALPAEDTHAPKTVDKDSDVQYLGSVNV